MHVMWYTSSDLKLTLNVVQSMFSQDCFSFCDNLIHQGAFFQAGTMRTRPWNTHWPFFGQNSTESAVYRIKTENRFVL